MRVVALVSGGKDSCYNMVQCVAAGHEIVALANLNPTSKGITAILMILCESVCACILISNCYFCYFR